MALFQHPHLTRGIVQTPKGAFVITRGFVSAPDEIGESLGWRRVDGEPRSASDPVVSVGLPGSSMRRDAPLVDHQ